mgnify:CR=1 FL=1
MAKGFKTGGRQKNTPNKATVERAVVAERIVRETEMSGRKLGKEVLADFMDVFAALATYHQPLPDGMTVPQGRKPDEAKFEKYARLAIQAAKDLAPYQSPTFRAIQIAAPPPEKGKRTEKRFTLKVFDSNRGGPPKEIDVKAKRVAGGDL